MLTIEDLHVRFPANGSGAAVPAVAGASLTLEQGKTLAVIGESGSGKSIMGLSICGLLPSAAGVKGRIVFRDRSLLDMAPQHLRSLRGRQISYVPQSAGLSLNPTMVCGRQVAEVFPRRYSHSRRKAGRLTRVLLSSLGLEKRVYGSHPHRLSGGMRQRVLVGMGLACAPDLLIADEPTKGIDAFRRREVADLFIQMRTGNPDMMLILITHDLHLAERLADEVAVMYAGRIMEQTPRAAFFRKPRHPYSQALLRALPERGLTPVPGSPPHPSTRIGGCVFHPRCAMSRPDCAAVIPPQTRLENGLVWCWRHADA
jgi:peptide/nickel transport system ATP-binding protein